MQIKLLTSIVGDNFSYARGDEIGWPDDNDACRMCAAGVAQPLGDDAKAIYADWQAAQKAASESAKKKREKDAERNEKEPERNEPETLHNEVPVEELDLDETTIKVLKAAGLETAGQVAAHPDLTKVDGIGKASAAKINSALAKL